LAEHGDDHVTASRTAAGALVLAGRFPVREPRDLEANAIASAACTDSSGWIPKIATPCASRSGTAVANHLESVSLTVGSWIAVNVGPNSVVQQASSRLPSHRSSL
jgi:hypothetical protein